MFLMMILCACAVKTPPPTILTDTSVVFTDQIIIYFSKSDPQDIVYFFLSENSEYQPIITAPVSPLVVQSPYPTILGSYFLILAAQRPGFERSDRVIRNVTIFQNFTVDTPIVSIVLGAGTANISVALPINLQLQTRFLLDDNSTMSISAPLYTRPVIVTTPGAHTIRLAQFKNFAFASFMSEILTYNFVVSQTPSPTISPSDGVYATGILQVEIQCTIPGCALFYTTDGTLPVLRFSGPVASPGNNSTLAFSSLTLFPGPRIVYAVSVYQGFVSSPVRSMFDVVGLLTPPQLNPPNGTILSLVPAVISISARNEANIWIIVRPFPDSAAPPLAFPSSEWTLLLSANVSLRVNASIFIVVDKLYFRPLVNITRAQYFFSPSAVVVAAVPGQFDNMLLLLLLLFIPIVVFGYVWMKRRQNLKKEAIENAIFSKHGYKFGNKTL